MPRPTPTHDQLATNRAFVTSHYPLIVEAHNIIWSKVHRPSWYPVDKDDFLQRLVLKLLLTSAPYDAAHNSKPSTWLYAVARNCYLDYIESQQNHYNKYIPLDSIEYMLDLEESTQEHESSPYKTIDGDSRGFVHREDHQEASP